MNTKPTILKWKGNLKADKIRDSAGTRVNMNYEQVVFFPKLKQNDPTIGLHSKLGKVYRKDIWNNTGDTTSGFPQYFIISINGI